MFPLCVCCAWQSIEVFERIQTQRLHVANILLSIVYVTTVLFSSLLKSKAIFEFVTFLVIPVNILEWDNRTLHDSVKAWQEYKALEKQTAGNPELAEHTAGRLRSIHSVMDELGRDAGNWETSIKISKRRKTVRVSD
nr:unnamed protein product [Haemonchus contortus]